MTRKKKSDPPPTRKLTATWTFETEQDLYLLSDKALLDEYEEPTVPLTREQEADLIIKRLKQTPAERCAEEMKRDEQRLVNILVKEIVKEIDDEVLAELMKTVDKRLPIDKEE